jgi:hypothetical protein
VSSAICDAPSGPAGPTHRLLVLARERYRPPAHFRCLLKPAAAAPLFYRNAMRFQTGAPPETRLGKVKEGLRAPTPGRGRCGSRSRPRGRDPSGPEGDDRTRSEIRPRDTHARRKDAPYRAPARQVKPGRANGKRHTSSR